MTFIPGFLGGQQSPETLNLLKQLFDSQGKLKSILPTGSSGQAFNDDTPSAAGTVEATTPQQMALLGSPPQGGRQDFDMPPAGSDMGGAVPTDRIRRANPFKRAFNAFTSPAKIGGREFPTSTLSALRMISDRMQPLPLGQGSFSMKGDGGLPAAALAGGTVPGMYGFQQPVIDALTPGGAYGGMHPDQVAAAPQAGYALPEPGFGVGYEPDLEEAERDNWGTYGGPEHSDYF